MGLIQAACFDATDFPAWSSRDPHDSSRGIGDPEARVGRGRQGFYLGYESLFLTDMDGFQLGHEEASANVNEKELVEPLLDRVLGEDLEVELLAGDSQFESQAVFDLLESLKISSIIAWRRLKGRENPPDVLTVKDRIDVEGPEWKRAIYKRLRAVVGGVQRQGEEQVGLRAAHMAGITERLYPCGSVVDGGLCHLHSRLRDREARAQAERRLLLLRMGLGWWTKISGCHGSLGVGEALNGVDPPLSTGLRGVVG
jgi:hypothetical protein